MNFLQDVRNSEKDAKGWQGADHVDLLRHATINLSRERILGIEHKKQDVPHTVELMRTRDYPVAIINGKVWQITDAVFRGRDGFDRLLDHSELYNLLMNTDLHDRMDYTPASGEALFNPQHAEGDGAGIVFGQSFEARVREGSSQGGTLTPEEIERYLEANPKANTSYNFVQLPFRHRPEIFSKVTSPGHISPSHEMYIVPRTHPVTNLPLANVPEPERVSYVNQHGQQIGEVIGIDSTGNGEEAISVNRLDNVKRYPGCATIGTRLLVVDPEATVRNQVGHPQADFEIAMSIYRDSKLMWSGSYMSGETQRSDDELNRESAQTRGSFKEPFFQFRGTAAVPPASFSLQEGDKAEVFCPGLGELSVRVRNVEVPESKRSLR